MAELKWFKVDPDIFNDEKIRIIETMPDADGILIVWFKLLALAARSMSDGVLMFDETMPYNAEILSAIFNRKKPLIELALGIFEKYKMIEYWDNGELYIINWEKYQTIDFINKIREQTRNRVAAHRERKKLENGNQRNGDSNATVTLRNGDVTEQIEIESKKEIENKKKKEIKELEDKEPKGSMSGKPDLQPPIQSKRIDYSAILEYWNRKSGLKNIKGITDRRKDFIQLRIKQVEKLELDGIDAIYQVIDNCRLSPFMAGQNKQGWIANFDWVFSKPQNFMKVLEGNYIEESKPSKGNRDLEERAARLERQYGGGE